MPGRSLARELVFAALPPLTHLGLTFEFKTWIARALDAENDPRGRLALSLGLGKAVHLLQSEPAMQSLLYRQAYELAKELGDISGALQALWGMATTGQAVHRPRQMIDAATLFHDFAVVNDRSSDSMVAECLIAFGLHDIGAFRAAEVHLRRVLAHYARSASARDAQRYLFNYRALALCWLASVEWRTGRSDEAARTAALAVAEAGHHVPTLFVTLSHAACPIALERSDWPTATRCIDEINRHCGHHIRWRRWADALSAILAIRCDRSRQALNRLDELLGEKGVQFPGQHFWYCLELIDGHLAFGHADRAELLTRSLHQELRDREEYWLLPEVIRVTGAVAGKNSCFSDFNQTLELVKLQNALCADFRLGFHVEGHTTAEEASRTSAQRRDGRGADSWSSTLLAYPRSDPARQRRA
jgi:hypothetical protein